MLQPYLTRSYLYFTYNHDHHVCHCGSATLTTAHVLRCVSFKINVLVFAFQPRSQSTTRTSYYDCITHVNGNTNKTVYLVSIEIFSHHEIEMCQILMGCLNQYEMFTEIQGEADHILNVQVLCIFAEHFAQCFVCIIGLRDM